VIVDELRVIGSAQTNKVMAAELIRVATRALGRRPPEPRKDGTGQLVYPFDGELAQVAVAYLRTPTRVLRDLYRVSATRLEPLYEELVRDVLEDARPWGDGAGTLSVMVSGDMLATLFHSPCSTDVSTARSKEESSR
jgi:hypothetical protein